MQLNWVDKNNPISFDGLFLLFQGIFLLTLPPLVFRKVLRRKEALLCNIPIRFELSQAHQKIVIGLIHAQKNTNQFKQEEIFSLEVWNLSAFDKYYVMVTVVSPEQEERELPWSPPHPKTQAHLLNSSPIDHVLQYQVFCLFSCHVSVMGDRWPGVG